MDLIFGLRLAPFRLFDVSFASLDGDRYFLFDRGGDEIDIIEDNLPIGVKSFISGDEGSDILLVDDDTFNREKSFSGIENEFISFNGFDTGGDLGISFAAGLNGDSGHDLIVGGNLGNDLFGGSGNDRLIGGALDDWLYGEIGDDVLIAGGGNGDVLDGGAGNDRLIGDDLDDWLIGGDGDDTLQAGIRQP